MTTALVGDEACFALELVHLHPDRRLDAAVVAADAVAIVTSLEGQSDARFVLQTLVEPDPDRPERGSIDVSILTVVRDASPDRVSELRDDLIDILSSPPLRWSFEPVQDEDRLAHLLTPFVPASFAEIARREEAGTPLDRSRPAGFLARPETGRPPRRDLWSTWTLGPGTTDLRRISSVLLAQEAPVCVRTVLEPTLMSNEERVALEDLVEAVGKELPDTGQARAALHTLESMLALRPLFETRCLVASSERLSRSLLSALGHSISEPADHTSPEPILRGGFAIIRAGAEADAGVLEAAYTSLATGEPTPTLGDPALVRLRRLMGPREAANLFRIPVTNHDRFPGVATVDVPELTPPIADLPLDGQRIGSLVGHGRLPVRLDPESRFRHTYVVGQTGTGKSTLLLQMALQDIASGDGVAVLDPHGDLVEDLLARIPTERAGDVVLLDPADPIAVVGVNLLEAETQVQAAYLIEELSHMFQTLFDPEQQGIVGPRYISMLRQGARLLMSNPDTPSSMLDIATVYGDRAVRRYLVERSSDPMAMEYWSMQDAASRSNEHGEVLAWFSSKFDAFRASDLVRNVLGQARSTISFSDVLNERRILLVNLSKGLLGSYNSGLIGYVVFTKLWAAALERAAQSKHDRAPFHVYIDEFQNMTSESLPTVLSEARKFNVSLTLANQFFSQVPDSTREAIMGNIGSKATFRLGPRDATLFEEWMGGDVRSEDLLTLPNHVALVALSQRGVPLPSFAVRTDPPPPSLGAEHAEMVRARSRQQWARPIAGLDEDYARRWAHIPDSFASRAKREADDESGRATRDGTDPGSGAPAATGGKGGKGGSFLDEWLAKQAAKPQAEDDT